MISHLYYTLYKFSQIFIPNTDALWAGGKLSINHIYRNSKKLMENVTMTFKKDNTRWISKYERRVLLEKICISFLNLQKENDVLLLFL